MVPVLGYWNIRGLATPIRLLLFQAGAQFEEKHYNCGPPPTFEREAWLKDRIALGLDFPNLPYYIEGDLKLTQSHVIMRHLAKRHQLAGNSERDRLRADLLATTLYDYLSDFGRTILFNRNHERNKEEYTKSLDDRLGMLSKFLADRPFAVGDSLTYADFVLYEYLEGQTFYLPQTIGRHANLVAFAKRIDETPAVIEYFKSAKAIKWPFFGAPAYVAGPYSDSMANNREKSKATRYFNTSGNFGETGTRITVIFDHLRGASSATRRGIDISLNILISLHEPEEDS